MRQRFAVQRTIVLACGLVAVPAQAANGLQVIGFGTESVGMGGADVAVARDTAALNTNPAGITQIRALAFDSYVQGAYALGITHRDALGNEQASENRWAVAGGLGFTMPISERVTAGVGIFAQGGSGNVFRDLRTPFGTRDELSALIGFLKLAPAIAWRATENLSLAVSVPVAGIAANQRVFPRTSAADPSDPSRAFFGLKLDDATGAGVGVKLGALWRASPSLQFGATAATKIGLPARNGEAELNLNAIGLGTVRYADAKLEGFALPPELTVGAAWQATARLLLSAEVSWLGWSHALRSTTITLSEPDNPAAPPTLSQTARIDARNQTVVAVGAAYAHSDATTFYAGANYGRSPFPEQNLTPLLAAFGEWHLTAGVSRRIAPQWTLGAALEYLVPRTVSYDNPASPLGPSTQRLSYVAMHLMIGRRW